MSMLSSQPNITYMKGHADDKKDDDNLTEAELSKKYCDAAAKEYWATITHADVPEPSSNIWMGPATLAVDSQTIVWAFRPSLIVASSGNTKGCFPSGSARTIAWEAQDLAASGAGTTQHQWLVKMVSGQGPIGFEMPLRKEWSDAGCPCCPEPFEPFSHVLPCPSSVGVWATGISGLCKWLTTTTSPWLARIIIQRLDDWHSGKPIAPYKSLLSAVRSAVVAQDALGWENMLTGIVSR